MHITAKTKPAPSNFYGDSKWQAEQKLQELFAQKQTADTRLAILRLPMIYGPGCKGNYRTLQKMAQKLPLFPTYHNERSVLQIEHLAEYLRMLVDSGEEGLFWPQDETYRSTPDMILNLRKSRKTYPSGSVAESFCPAGILSPGKPGKLARKAFGTLTIERQKDLKTDEKYGMNEIY